MYIHLEGKNVLVTGSSRGIGRAIIEALVLSGANVVIHYNSNRERAETLAEVLGNNTPCIQADLADPVACTRLFDETVEFLGSLDVLVNNAGIAIEIPLEASLTEWLEAWNRTMDVNLRASQLLSRLAIRHFKRQGHGRIINIASRAAFRGDTAEFMAYAASKAGMVALTRSIARAYGKDGITAFVVAPGFTRTEMARDFIDTYGEEYVSNDIALSRLTEPRDIGPIVAFLASGLADHATGTTIDVNAGSYIH